MNLRQLAALSLATVLGSMMVMGCGQASSASMTLEVTRTPFADRAALLSVGADDPVQRLLAEPARQWVVYWPAAGECAPYELESLDALVDLEGRQPDTRLVTVLPGEAHADGVRYGRPLPGTLVRLSPEEHVRQSGVAPLPRLEVWTGDGRLVLWKSLSTIDRRDSLLDELAATRLFTRPLESSP